VLLGTSLQLVSVASSSDTRPDVSVAWRKSIESGRPAATYDDTWTQQCISGSRCGSVARQRKTQFQTASRLRQYSVVTLVYVYCIVSRLYFGYCLNCSALNAFAGYAVCQQQT